MTLPTAIETIWNDMQTVRAEVLAEAEPLTQGQADWRPGPAEWSVGEIVHHLTIAEMHTGKLTTKLLREAEAAGTIASYPPALEGFAPLPAIAGEPGEAPPVVWPTHARPLRELIADMRGMRERSRGSIEKVGTVDPRRLVFKHFRFGDLNIAQWWMLQAHHDGIHLRQIRAVKSSPGFPAA